MTNKGTQSLRWIGVGVVTVAVLVLSAMRAHSSLGVTTLPSPDGALVVRVVHTSNLDNYFNYYVAKSNGGAEFHLGCLSDDDPARAPREVSWADGAVLFVVGSGQVIRVEIDPSSGSPIGELDPTLLTCPGYP